MRVMIGCVIDVGITRIRGRGAFERSKLVCDLWAKLVLCSSLIAGSMGDLTFAERGASRLSRVPSSTWS